MARSLSLFATAFGLAALAGCSGQAEAEAESVETSTQALSARHSYTVRLHEMNASRIRAKYNDTIVVMISAKVNGVLLDPASYNWGDHGSGDYYPELPFSFEANDDDNVEVLVSILNAHDPNGAGAKARDVLNTISDNAEKYVQSVYPLGPVWPAVNSAIHTVNGWFVGGCDGSVAADSILGKGATFRDWTARGTYYGPVQRHDGTNSPWYCGATSLYFTQYTVTRNW